MNNAHQVAVRLPQDLYLKIEAESRKSGEKVAAIVRKKLIESAQNEAEKARAFTLEKRLEAMEEAIQNQLKIVTKIDRALSALGGGR
jgi:predicted DNA-binding protein